MFPSRTPPSPTKPKSGFSLHNLLTGVTPCPPATHAERWGKGPLSPPKQPIKVAQMVERYEAASLSASRDYSSIPPAPPSPSKIYNPSFKALPLSQSTSPPASPTKVPASFFQQSRSPLMNGLPAPPTPGKENSRPPILLRSSMRNSPPPSPTRSNRKKLSKDSDYTEISDTGATDGGGSTVSAIPPFELKTEVAHSTFKISDPVPTRQRMMPATEQKPKVVERSIPPPTKPHKEIVRVSSFTEALPPSLPSLESSFFNPMDWESEVERAQNVTVAEDFSTVEHSASGPALSNSVYLPASGFEIRETESERIAKIEADFARLLDSMQLSSGTIRAKMLTITLPLKIEMLRSASPTTPSPQSSAHQRGKSLSNFPNQPTTPPLETSLSIYQSKMPGFLRKTKSSTSLALQNSESAPTGSPYDSRSRSRSTSRPRPKSVASASAIFKSLGRAAAGNTKAQLSAVGGTLDGGSEDPTWWAVRIRSSKCSYGTKSGPGTITGESELGVKELARLKARLRAEAPSWVEEFLRSDGYQGLCERLQEVLDLEWRQEQHDDRVLHEILRCFKALSLTSSGKKALCSRSPAPYTALTSLLFSEKKPGDLPPRQVLVEILLDLFEICPPTAKAIERNDWTISLVDEPMSPEIDVRSEGGSGGRRYTRKMKGQEEEEDSHGISDERRKGTHELMRTLMMGPPDEKEESKLDFMRDAHRPRAYKAWITELAGTVRDYYWIFCHTSNLIWSLELLNAESIEAPKVPSGMTGGVESEAMLYCISHFRLINALARSCSNRQEATALHVALFESGIERIILTLRRSSQDYYAPLHLELARYVDLARKANFNLGPKILGFLDSRMLTEPERQVLAQYARHQQKALPLLAEIAF